MKKIFYVSLVSVMLIACTKYENGPDFALKTKKERISNNWVLNEAVHLSGDDTRAFSAIYPEYQFNIGQDDTYTLFYRPSETEHYSEKGHWKFSSDKLHFTTTCDSGAETDYHILRLANNELWVRFTDNSNEWELHLFPKSM